MNLVARAATLDGFVAETADPAGLTLRDVEPLSVLLVCTRNSQYRIIVCGGSQVVVQGGAFFADPTPAHLDGSSFGGSFLKIGWIGGESIVDTRFTLHYLRTTADGRIAFGAGTGRAGFGGRIGASFTDDLDAARRAARGFVHLFPQLRDVALEEAWGGPIDITDDHFPYFGTLPGGRVHFGHGYAGNGVSQAHVGGRILSALALGQADDMTALPLVGRMPRSFPPEPFRFMGARMFREAVLWKEEAEQEGRRAPWPVRALARLPRRMGYHIGPS